MAARCARPTDAPAPGRHVRPCRHSLDRDGRIGSSLPACARLCPWFARPRLDRGANGCHRAAVGGGQPQRAPAIFAELVTRGVDVIAMGGSRWLREAAQQATKTIPTVLLFDADPVAEGVVPSLARPGGNLTGVTISTGGEFIGKRLQLLKELAPAVTRVACIASSEVWESYRRSTAAADIPPVVAPVDRSEQFAEAFATILRERADAGHGRQSNHLC